MKGKATAKGKIWLNAGLSKRSEMNDAEDLGNRKIGKRRQILQEERLKKKSEKEGANVMEDGKALTGFLIM